MEQLTVCLDVDPLPDMTLTCATSEYIEISSAHVYITPRKTTEFCNNPSHDTTSCTDPLHTAAPSIQNYFEGCNTLSSCKKRVPLNQTLTDSLLAICKTKFMYDGDAYIDVSYECKPRKYYSLGCLFKSFLKTKNC